MSLTRKLFVIAFAAVAALWNGQSQAHVPYFEHQDFSEDSPFVVKNNIDQSIAVYAWLETDGENPTKDVDVYRFEINEPARIYAELLVPVCPAYRDFVPWFLLAGPGLPAPEMDLPFEIPEGAGVIVMENVVPGSERETFYEPFGAKSYYSGPVLDQVVEAPGVYYLYFWDPHQTGGDYVGVLGWKEIWTPRDIARALFYTPRIRQDKELHTDCTPD
jgi:hypothetical protein